MSSPSFVVIGSGGGGGTIAWILARAGYKVTLLEQGDDLADSQFSKTANGIDPEGFDRGPHDEFFFRVKRPDPKRRLRGDYNTFRRTSAETAKPFKNGWTGSTLGGGSVIWGTWAYRALPIDYKLATTFKHMGMLNRINQQWKYSVADWPIDYAEMVPFYHVAETLLAVSGSREGFVQGVTDSPWFTSLAGETWFQQMFPKSWCDPKVEYPCIPYPITPVGRLVYEGMRAAKQSPCPLPTAIVSPGTTPYETRRKLAEAARALGGSDFWKTPETLWSDRVRQACNMCGFCGEYLCWGGAHEVSALGQKPGAPKSGTHSTVLQELYDLKDQGHPVEIITNAKVFEILYAEKRQRAKGVKFLDVKNSDRPRPRELAADFVILSGGAVQSARLLWMSGPSRGLGNQHDQLGRNATFHLFGLSVKAVLKATKETPGLLHGEFGHTGNVTSFAPYFVRRDSDPAGEWFKSGTITSTAMKNPMEKAIEKTETVFGSDLLKSMDTLNRTIEIRLTGDDLPRPTNRVDLDPAHVDEYGLPVARITRDTGIHEWQMFDRVKPMLSSIFDPFKDKLEWPPRVSPHLNDLIGDHQMGTCRMGDDPKKSVIDRWCRVHEAPNLFVVDSSFMPTGLGLNPMVSVVANALRVGTFIADTLAKGGDPSQ